MKSLFFLLSIILCFNCTLLKAQIQVGSITVPDIGDNSGELSQWNLEEFKKTTTLFTLQTMDYQHKADFEKILQRVWTITPFQIIRLEEIDKYLKAGSKEYSFASFDAYVIHSKGSIFPHITYDIWMPEYRKYGSYKQKKRFARILLYADPASNLKAINTMSSQGRTKKYHPYLLAHLYDQSTLYNWSPGFISAALAVVSQRLSDRKLRSMYTQIRNIDGLKALSKDTLYIPSYVNNYTNPQNGKEIINEESDENTKAMNNSLKEIYPYPAKYISNEELNRKILSGENFFYYLILTKSSSDKHISIYSTNNEEIYSERTIAQVNFKERDLHRLAHLIAKYLKKKSK